MRSLFPLLLALACAPETTKPEETSSFPEPTDTADTATGVDSYESGDSDTGGVASETVRVFSGITKLFETTFGGKLQTMLDGFDGENGLYGINALPAGYGESGPIPGSYQFVWIDANGAINQLDLDQSTGRSYGWSTRLGDHYAAVSYTSSAGFADAAGKVQAGDQYGVVVIDLNSRAIIADHDISKYGLSYVTSVMEYNGKLFVLANNINNFSEETSSTGFPVMETPSVSSILILDNPQLEETNYDFIDLPNGSSNAASLALTQDALGNDLLVVAAVDQWGGDPTELGQSAFYIDPENQILLDNHDPLYQGIGMNGLASVNDIGEVLLTGADILGQSIAILDPVSHELNPLDLNDMIANADDPDAFTRTYIADAVWLGGTDTIAFSALSGSSGLAQNYLLNPYSGENQLIDSNYALENISPATIGDESFCHGYVYLDSSSESVGGYMTRVVCWAVKYTYQ